MIQFLDWAPIKSSDLTGYDGMWGLTNAAWISSDVNSFHIVVSFKKGSTGGEYNALHWMVDYDDPCFDEKRTLPSGATQWSVRDLINQTLGGGGNLADPMEEFFLDDIDAPDDDGFGGVSDVVLEFGQTFWRAAGGDLVNIKGDAA